MPYDRGTQELSEADFSMEPNSLSTARKAALITTYTGANVLDPKSGSSSIFNDALSLRSPNPSSNLKCGKGSTPSSSSFMSGRKIGSLRAPKSIDKNSVQTTSN